MACKHTVKTNILSYLFKNKRKHAWYTCDRMLSILVTGNTLKSLTECWVYLYDLYYSQNKFHKTKEKKNLNNRCLETEQISTRAQLQNSANWVIGTSTSISHSCTTFRHSSSFCCLGSSPLHLNLYLAIFWVYEMVLLINPLVADHVCKADINVAQSFLNQENTGIRIQEI